LKNLREYSKIPWELQFKYDPLSRSFLSRLDGSPVGTKSSKDKWVVFYNKAYWQISRVVLYLFKKLTDDTLVVDHRDGNGLNNNIDNLRLVTQSVNSLNKKKQRNNQTGVTGVSFHKRDQYYSAYTEYNGVPKLELFYIKQHGNTALSKAIAARKMYESSNKQMTERHGK